MLSFDEIRSLLKYDPETGDLVWIAPTRGPRKFGATAGRINKQGYRQIQIKGRFYQADRLAWLLMKSEWPDGQMYHINRDRADNRFCNLRVVTPSQNNINRCLKNTVLKGTQARPAKRSTGRLRAGRRARSSLDPVVLCCCREICGVSLLACVIKPKIDPAPTNPDLGLPSPPEFHRLLPHSLRSIANATCPYRYRLRRRPRSFVLDGRNVRPVYLWPGGASMMPRGFWNFMFVVTMPAALLGVLLWVLLS